MRTLLKFVGMVAIAAIVWFVLDRVMGLGTETGLFAAILVGLMMLVLEDRRISPSEWPVAIVILIGLGWLMYASWQGPALHLMDEYVYRLIGAIALGAGGVVAFVLRKYLLAALLLALTVAVWAGLPWTVLLVVGLGFLWFWFVVEVLDLELEARRGVIDGGRGAYVRWRIYAKRGGTRRWRWSVAQSFGRIDPPPPPPAPPAP